MLFHHHELPTLFIAIFIEEAGIPIPAPGDTLVTLAGTLGPHTLWHALAVIGVSSAAVFGGSSVLFVVAQRGGRPLLNTYGAYILLNERRVARMERWFARRGRMAVIFGRLIPGLRIPTTIMAGISGIGYREYAVTGAIAAVVWSTFYYALGSLLGRAAPFIYALLADVLDDVPRGLLVAVALVAVTVGGIAGGRHAHGRIQRRRAAANKTANKTERGGMGDARMDDATPQV